MQQVIEDIKRTVDEKPSAKSKKRHFKNFLQLKYVALLCVLLVAALILFLLVINRSSGPIPQNIKKSVSFPVYYPSSLPRGYALEKSSVQYENQILFFSLNHGSRKISVSEQVAPKNPPDFDLIQKGNTSFKKLDTTGGEAIYGVSQSIPAAILLTNTTLINIRGSKDVPLDVIGKLIQNMSSE
jgi:hypothetical protein